ncbi:Cys/Met metabolism PLP-dependent enzyme-domain-containing protein [Tricladium varicosporioides]|nr:Cys/Met metabolism PLP-dependent enzyme-domain-containing protein [Hymenoscyphus varicosporioides]
MSDPFTPYKVTSGDTGRKYNTLQVHAGHKPDSQTRSRAVPIYATASYVFTDSEHAKRVCSNQEAGYVYSRISNPTVEVFEKRAAALEGGSAAVACASGQSAVFQSILNLAGSGDNIVASINLYGGTYSLFKTLLPRLGITVKWAANDSPTEVAELIDLKTKMVFVETIGNPRGSVPDLQAIANVAHREGVPFIVDNTFGACGAFCRVIDHGADIVVHSATKWMGGHGTTVGGVVIDSGRFDWGANSDRFPHLTEETGPMKFSYWKIFGKTAFAMALRINVVMEVGSVLNPFAAQQLLLGMETLSLRCERIASNTLALARYLESHPRISWVNYPGLETNKYYALAKKYLTGGFGGVLSFGIKGGAKASDVVVNKFQVVSNMTNVGDSKTMATHPWSSTHVIMSVEDRIQAGITEDLIRLSVGTEDIEDLTIDLCQALAAIPQEYLMVESKETVLHVSTGDTEQIFDPEKQALMIESEILNVEQNSVVVI